MLHIVSAPGQLTGQQTEVAFHVQKQNPQSGLGTIAFERVITEQGGVWNSVVHNFLIPTKGMYYLHHTVMANYDGWVSSEIRRDTTSLQPVQTYVRHGSGTASIVVELESFAQMSCYVATGEAGVRGDLYTHFNGFLLYTM